jgi:transcription elongation factor GreA
MERIILTREGYNKMSDELNLLATKRRREVADMLEKARAHGDLRENAEYDAAKQAKQNLETRIGMLQDRLARAEIVEISETMSIERAVLGLTVEIHNEESKDVFEYTLVSQDEANFAEGKISITSPIGKGLLGKMLNEIAEINIPAGLVRFRVVKIFRK